MDTLACSQPPSTVPRSALGPALLQHPQICPALPCLHTCTPLLQAKFPLLFTGTP